MQLLGLIDAIESTLLDSKRMPFTHYLVVHEKMVVQMLNKLRQLAQSEAAMPRNLRTQSSDFQDRVPVEQPVKKDPAKKDADEYAEEVLTQLQIVATRILRQVENGRRQLEKKRN
jgi:hypothetical protein